MERMRADRYMSPFRYPGGKTWLTARARAWRQSLVDPPARLLEPFAGGASIGLTAAAEGWFEHIELVELDAEVAAVWSLVFADSDRDLVRLCARIAGFSCTTATVRECLASAQTDSVSVAFRTVVKNRCRRNGILAPTAGLMREVSVRWFPDAVITRLWRARALRDRVTFTHGDGIAAMERSGRAAWFVDPPYTAGATRAGARLYTHHACDHDRLLDLVAAHTCPVLVTYDDDPWVRSAVIDRGLLVRSVEMLTGAHACKQELLITNRVGSAHTCGHDEPDFCASCCPA